MHKYPIIESHCHLDSLRRTTIEQVIKKGQEIGIERFITISVAPRNLSTVLALAEKNPSIYCTQGVQPHDSKSYSSQVERQIIKNAAHKKVVAIGEIGLDYNTKKSTAADQQPVFERQLQLAADLDLPIVVHTRDADEDTLAILKNYAPLLKKKGVIHSFSSGKALAEWSLDAGFDLGFNGMVTFPSAISVRDAVALTPLNRIQLETDSPHLSPVPHRGRENDPTNLVYIAQKIAEIKRCSYEQVLEQCYENSIRLFFSNNT